jgi:hypothetical protein
MCGRWEGNIRDETEVQAPAVGKAAHPSRQSEKRIPDCTRWLPRGFPPPRVNPRPPQHRCDLENHMWLNAPRSNGGSACMRATPRPPQRPAQEINMGGQCACGQTPHTQAPFWLKKIGPKFVDTSLQKNTAGGPCMRAASRPPQRLMGGPCMRAASRPPQRLMRLMGSPCMRAASRPPQRLMRGPCMRAASRPPPPPPPRSPQHHYG